MKITIEAGPGKGKTTIALVLKKWLEDMGIAVRYVNPDGPEASHSELPWPALLARSAQGLRGPAATKAVEIVERTWSPSEMLGRNADLHNEHE